MKCCIWAGWLAGCRLAGLGTSAAGLALGPGGSQHLSLPWSALEVRVVRAAGEPRGWFPCSAPSPDVKPGRLLIWFYLVDPQRPGHNPIPHSMQVREVNELWSRGPAPSAPAARVRRR